MVEFSEESKQVARAIANPSLADRLKQGFVGAAKAAGSIPAGIAEGLRERAEQEKATNRAKSDAKRAAQIGYAAKLGAMEARMDYQKKINSMTRKASAPQRSPDFLGSPISFNQAAFNPVEPIKPRRFDPLTGRIY